jgi:hypothetical protein
MPLIQFSSPHPKLSTAPKQIKVAIGIFALVGAATIGTTLASNISLNGGGNVEFGQGVAQTTACDSNVILTPTSTFVNSEGGGDFLFTSVTVSDISESCFGKIFTIKAYKNGENAPLDLYRTGFNGGSYTSYSEIQINNFGGNFTLENAGLLSDDITSTDSDNFTVSFVTEGPPPSEALASALDVDRITIESADIVYEIGDVGPSGGVIIYAAETRQNWGRYIEVAPADWNGSDGDVANAAWCSNTFLDVNSATTAIGFAEANTDRMIAPNCSSGIGVLARSYQGGGNTDWSVPTSAEMLLISNYSYLIPGLIIEGPSGNNGYWVSNGGSGGGAWVGNVQVVGGGQGGVNKASIAPYLRPIRYF